MENLRIPGVVTMIQPTTRCQRYLEAAGYRVDVVERAVGRGKRSRRFDYLGFADLLAIRDEVPPGWLEQHQGAFLYGERVALPVLAVNATSASGGNVSSRASKWKKKPKVESNLRLWLQAGHDFEVHGWRGLGAFRKVAVCLDPDGDLHIHDLGWVDVETEGAP